MSAGEREFLTRFAHDLADRVAERLAERDDRPLLRVRDVAARLGLDERTVRGMIGSGVLPSFKVEGARVVAPAALDAYIRAQQQSEGEGEAP